MKMTSLFSLICDASLGHSKKSGASSIARSQGYVAGYEAWESGDKFGNIWHGATALLFGTYQYQHIASLEDRHYYPQKFEALYVHHGLFIRCGLNPKVDEKAK